MGPVPPTLVGEVQSVSGSTVSVRLRAGLSSLALVGGESYRVGQVGAFLRVPLGYSHLYGVCSQVGAAALPHAIVGQGEAAIDGRWLTLTLFGESLAGEFQRGVSQYPTFGDEVHLVTNDELAQIYRSPDIQVPLVIGTIASASGIEARVDLAKLVTRHSVVVGSSGAGKSNLVGVLLEAIAAQGFGAARVLVLDPHGEYASAGDNGKVFSIKPENAGQEPLFVPFWALPFDELMQTTLGVLNTNQDGAIREEVAALKRATAAHLPVPTPVGAVTADSPIPFSVRRLWFDLDDYETRTYQDNGKTQIEPPTTVGDAEALIPNVNPHQALGGGSPFQGPRRGLTRGLELMRNRLRDSRYQFLFTPGPELTPNAQGQTTEDLDSLVASWVGHDRPITVIDLSSAPADVLSLVAGTVLRIIYDALFWAAGLPISGREQPLLVVLEEAHLFLPDGADSAAQRTVATVAKEEGRKYGVGLMLVTQRPTELDSTSISQCGTMIALRLTNQADRSRVTSTMPDDLANLAGLLPSLRTGEALIVGEAIPIPSRVRIPMATNKLVGSDPDLAHGWIDEPRPGTAHYTTALANWRAQTGATHPSDGDPGDHDA